MRAKSISDTSSDQTHAGSVRTFAIGGQLLSAPKVPSGLYLVATPIGNLGDITLRALETLASVDVVACEDTRITRRLIDRYGIKAHSSPITNTMRRRLGRKSGALAQGASIALVSDAGTPLISIPASSWCGEVCAAGHSVIALPGPSSVLTALSVAALPTDRFFFEGFLPSKQMARRTRLAELARIDATLVMFESGGRVQETLHDLADVMGERDAAICRELTKLHEEVCARQKVSELAQWPMRWRPAGNSSSCRPTCGRCRSHE